MKRPDEYLTGLALDRRFARTNRFHDALVGRRAMGDPEVAERITSRRLSRGRWKDVGQFDARVADLEHRQREITDELAGLRERERLAPALDAERLAAWELDDRRGPRPEPELPAIREAIQRGQEDHAGLSRAIDRVLADKLAHVERHRRRLVDDAERDVEEAHARLTALFGELERARQDLADARQAALWANLFPDVTASASPNYAVLALGLRRPVEQALGIPTQLQAERVLMVLRADADALRTAATPAQRTQLEGAKPRTPREVAMWADSDEARFAERQEKQAAIQRHIEMWGAPPA